LIGVISAAVAICAVAAVAASSSSVNTPLYMVRMEQASSEMNFLPTDVNAFAYNTEKGCTFEYGIAEYCYGAVPLDTGSQDTCYGYLTCTPSCFNGWTCDGWTCWVSCDGFTCSGITCWYSCDVFTCQWPYTCPNTCPATCGSTCSTCQGQGWTCDATGCQNTCSTCDQPTCPNTCWETCDDPTCFDTCERTCRYTCNKPCIP
jgi:hypothetical protein